MFSSNVRTVQLTHLPKKVVSFNLIIPVSGLNYRLMGKCSPLLDRVTEVSVPPSAPARLLISTHEKLVVGEISPSRLIRAPCFIRTGISHVKLEPNKFKS